jgi:polysaccharide biosynthesis/export protein
MNRKPMALVAFIFLSILCQGGAFKKAPGLEIFGQKIFKNFSSVPDRGMFYVNNNYILGRGDNLIINIWGAVEEEYTKEIESDGCIYLPRIGKIYLQGKQLVEGKDILRRKILESYKNISISITTGKLRTFDVFVLGEVKKPGRYQISPCEDIIEILSLAGGPTEKGSLRKIRIINRQQGKEKILDLYPFLLKGELPAEHQFSPGDAVFVPLAEFMAGIEGAVRKPAVYEMTRGSKASDLIELCGGFLPYADFSRIQIERENKEETGQLIDIEFTDLEKTRLENFDLMRVFEMPEEEFYRIHLQGAVKRPGWYGWKENLKLGDILKQEELGPYALREKAEIVRTTEWGSKKVLTFSPRRLFHGDSTQDFKLQPQDKILIYSQERPEKKVIIKGEIYYPGEYVITHGEKLKSVIERAGGMTPEAFPQGIEFYRQTIKEEREKHLNVFIREKEAAIQREEQRVEEEEEVKLLEKGKVFLKQLKEMEVKGRIVLDFKNGDIEEKSAHNIMLQDRDIIYIPEKPLTVAVTGEVNYPTNIIFDENLKFQDFIQKSGGFTRNADRKHIYIARSDGTATLNTKNIKTGDTIVIPFLVKDRAGKIVKDIVQMFYHVSLGVAAAF